MSIKDEEIADRAKSLLKIKRQEYLLAMEDQNKGQSRRDLPMLAEQVKDLVYIVEGVI